MIDFTNDRQRLLHSGLTVLGLGAAALDAFVITGPWGLAGLCLAYIAGGLPPGMNALHTLWKRHVLDIDFLMILAAIAAAVVDAALEGAVLLTLFSISTTLEHRAMARARRAVEALMKLRPDTTLKKLADGETIEVQVRDLAPGDVVVLRPGSRVPADGVVLEGTGSMDEATITGESMPVEKIPGSKVFEATINLNSVLVMTVSRAITESTVARMIALVTEAQAARAPSERFSEWFGQKYTIAVVVGSVLAFATLLFLGWSFDVALYRAATILESGGAKVGHGSGGIMLPRAE